MNDGKAIHKAYPGPRRMGHPHTLLSVPIPSQAPDLFGHLLQRDIAAESKVAEV